MIELPIINAIWEKYTKDKNVQVFVEKNFYDEINIRTNNNDTFTSLRFPNPNETDEFKSIQTIFIHFGIPFEYVLEICGNKIGSTIIFFHNEKWYSYIDWNIQRYPNQYEICGDLLTDRIFITKQ